MRKRTRMGEAGLAIGVAALLAWLFWPQPVAVEVATAERGRLAAGVGGEGRVRVRNLHVVAAPLAGRLQRIGLEPGDAVLTGEAVALLTPPQPGFLDSRSRAAVLAAARAADSTAEAAAAALAAAEARLAVATADLRRTQALGRFAARQALDLAGTIEATRRAGVEAAAAGRLAARALSDLSRAALVQPYPGRPPEAALQITAPASGRVLQVMRRNAGDVPAGMPLLTIGDPADIEVVVRLPSEQAAGLRPGMPARIERWGGPALPGRVSRIEPAGWTMLSLLGFEEQRVAVVVAILAPAAAHAGLGHGYRADVHIDTGIADALMVPIGALVRDGAGWTVYVVEDGTARRRAVALGRRNAAAAEVIGGLRPGEAVAVYPGEHVADGVTVRPR